LLMIGYGLFSYLKFDTSKWREVQNRNDLLAYTDYLDTVYLFRYNKQAREILEQKEEELWQLCQEKKQAANYETYLANYSQTKYKEEAQQKHYQLLWEEALQKNQAEVYKKFLKMYPDSPHFPQADSLFTVSLWEQYKEKNSMIYFTFYIWKYPTSTYLEQAKLLREKVFFSIITVEFWQDKWHDLRDFFVATDNLWVKFVLLAISIILILIVYFKKRSVKVK
jgi:hypothetical protein